MLEQCPGCLLHFGSSTTRQQLISHLLGHGMPRVEIARILDLSPSKVAYCIKRYGLKRPRDDLLVNPLTRDILAESGRL